MNVEFQKKKKKARTICTAVRVLASGVLAVKASQPAVMCTLGHRQAPPL
jgi:hypothetical protein